MSSPEQPGIPLPTVLRSARTALLPRVLELPGALGAGANGDAARRRVEEALAESRERGRAEGRSEIREEMVRRIDEVRGWLEAQTEAIRNAEREYLHGAEAVVIELTLKLVAKILNREVQAAPDIAREGLKDLLSVVADRCEVRVRVSPDSIDGFRELEDEFAGLISAPEGIRWVPDRRVAPGGAVVETESGTIDATIEAKLEEAASLFREILNGRSS